MTKKSLQNLQTAFADEMQVNTDTNAVKEFQKKIREKVFFLRDTDVTPRMYNLWRSEGLVSQEANPKERKWVSFNLRDFIWVQMVYDLRLMGVSVADIKKAKELCLGSLMKKVDEKLWQKSLEAVIRNVRKNKQLSEEQVTEVEEYYKANSLNKILTENAEMNLTFLDAALSHIISTGNDFNLYLFLPSQFSLQNQKSGKANTDVNESKPEFKYTTESAKRKMRQSGLHIKLFSPDFTKNTLGKNSDPLFDVPHIKIPIKNYLWAFLLDPSMQNQLSKMELLSPEELRLIEQTRLGNKKEITIKFNDGKLERLEVKKDMDKSAERRLIELFTRDEYCNIQFSVEAGKISYMHKTSKKKIK